MKLLSIGALARATAVPVATLRTWERRYGFPEPVRLPSGHRRYRPETVARLSLVRQALAVGGRASEVVAAPIDELRALTRGDGSLELDDLVARWIDSVMRLRADELEGHFRVGWDRYGAGRFVEELAVHFLRSIGYLWVDGRLRIAHEHFATEHLRDFLARRWRGLGETADGGRVVCATLPGEAHTIGLHLAAVLLTLNGRPVTLLGADTPPGEVARAVVDCRAHAVLIGTSAVAPPNFGDDVRRVRSELDDDVPLLVGGPLADAAIADVPGIVHLPELASLTAWSLGRGVAA